MEYNGFDGFRFEEHDDDSSSLIGPFSPDMSPEEVRATLAANGSGLIKEVFQQNDDRVITADSDTGAGIDSLSSTDKALYIEADVSPREEISARGGCIDFSRKALLMDHPGYMNRQQLSDAYGEFMQIEFFGSPEFAAIQTDWSECMSLKGFGGLHSQGTELDALQAEAETVLSQGFASDSDRVQALLEEDKTISVAAFDCDQQVAPKRLKLKNEKAALFAAANKAEVESLMSAGTS